MALPTIPYLNRVAITGTTELGTPWVNVLHFNFASGWATATDELALNVKLTKLYTGPAYSAGYEWLMKRCRAPVTANKVTHLKLDGSAAANQYAASWVGVDPSTQSIPASSSMVLSLHTGFRGAARRGRVYLPQYGVDAFGPNGNLGSSVALNIAGQAASFLADLAGSGWTWVVASYTHTDFKAVTTVTMDLAPDHQNRRKS